MTTGGGQREDEINRKGGWNKQEGKMM
jgi:hypothetical protein